MGLLIIFLIIIAVVMMIFDSANTFLVLAILFGVTLLLVSIKALADYFKYGKKIFSSFTSDMKEDYRMDLICNDIKAVYPNGIMLKPNNIPCDLILLTKKKVYVFDIFPCNEQIKGKLEDEFLRSHSRKYKNPFYRLLVSADVVHSKLHVDVEKIIVIDDLAIINTLDPSCELVALKNVRNKLTTDKFDVYTDEQMEQFKETMKQCM